MKIYLVKVIGYSYDAQVVVCNDINELIELCFNGDLENFLNVALVVDLTKIKNSQIALNIGRDGNRFSDELLIEIIKAGGVEEISQYVQENIRDIYLNLNYIINPDKQYLNYEEDYQEEIRQIINIFRGRHLISEGK